MLIELCVRDKSLSVETSGSIHDSPTAVPERPNQSLGVELSYFVITLQLTLF